VKESALQAFDNAPIESPDDVDKNHILPDQFTPKGMEKKALENVGDDGNEHVADTMGAGINRFTPKGLTKEANKNIEADDEKAADALEKDDEADEEEAIKEAEKEPAEQKAFDPNGNTESSDASSGDSAAQPVNIDMVGSAKVPDGDDDALDHLTIDGDDHLVEPETPAPKHAVSDSASMEDIVAQSTFGTAATSLGKTSLHQKTDKKKKSGVEKAKEEYEYEKKQYEQAKEAVGEDNGVDSQSTGIDEQSAGIDDKYADIDLFHSADSQSASVEHATTPDDIVGEVLDKLA
jgi:hypothetical protein